MKNIKNRVSDKITLPVVLMAALPLLVLGGCAGNDTKSFSGDNSLAGTEINISQEPAVNADLDDLSVDMLSTEDQSYQAPADVAENVESGEVTESVDETVVEDIVIADQIPEPQEKIIGFGFDQSDIDMQYTELLIQHAEYLRQNKNLVLHVGGHTDSSGDEAYNAFLSKKRANSVAGMLLGLGVPEEQIKISGNASDEPLMGAISHREHRRVELNYQDQNIVSN